MCIYLCVCLLVALPLYLFVSSLFFSVGGFVSVSVSVSVSLSRFQSLCVSLSLSLYAVCDLSLSLSLFLFSVRRFVFVSLCLLPSLYALSVALSLCLFTSFPYSMLCLWPCLCLFVSFPHLVLCLWRLFLCAIPLVFVSVVMSFVSTAGSTMIRIAFFFFLGKG